MQQLRALLPLILGLATSRTLNISLGYSNYTQTDAGIITDGSTLIRCALFVLLAILIIKHNWHFSDRTNTYLLRVCMITTPLCVLASFFINPALNDSFFSVLIACILSLPSSLFALMWLTFAKKLNAHDIALFVIVGGMASEIFIYGVSLLPPTLSLGVLLALCALQPVLIKVSALI